MARGVRRSSRPGSRWWHSLANQNTALLTGTNRGTGRAIAEALNDSGWKVISLNRTLARQAWMHEIQCDLEDLAQVDRAITEALAIMDNLDACVFNAAVRRLAPIADLPISDLLASIAINQIAPFRLTQAMLPLMRISKGTFVFMGSHAATRYFEGGAAYSSTKAAQKSYVETLLLEERPHGIRSILVSPGAIANRPGDDSPLKMSARSVGAFVATLLNGTPSDVVIGEVEIRPARLATDQRAGIARLQRV